MDHAWTVSARSADSSATAPASAGGIAGVHELLDAREGALHPVRVERRLHRADDLLRGRGLRALAGVEELLVDLLARAAGPTISIADVHVRLEPGQPDHVAGQVDDLHRVAHLEHEHLAAGGQLARSG